MRCRLERGWRRCWWSSHPRAGQQETHREDTPACFFKWYSPRETRVLKFVGWLSSKECENLTYIKLEYLRSSIPFGTAALSPNFLKIHKPEAYFNPSPRLENM